MRGALKVGTLQGDVTVRNGGELDLSVLNGDLVVAGSRGRARLNTASGDIRATGIEGDQVDDCDATTPTNCATDSGAVYLFAYDSTTGWVQQAYIKASNTGANDNFGNSVALSADGTTLAVAAVNESSSATGIDGDQSDNTAANSGAVYLFSYDATTRSWIQGTYIKASNTGAGDRFGSALGLSADGATLAVGADIEASSATGIGGDETINSTVGSGAVYLFTRATVDWSQQAYIKATNSEEKDYFGNGIALSGDGATLAVAAPFEASGATGIGGDQSDNSATESGALYLY
jgi:hypothetical protein